MYGGKLNRELTTFYRDDHCPLPLETRDDDHAGIVKGPGDRPIVRDHFSTYRPARKLARRKMSLAKVTTVGEQDKGFSKCLLKKDYCY